MYILGAIERETYKEVVLLEEGTPVVVHKDAVCLQGVLNDLVTCILALQFHCLAEEWQTGHQRLTAMPAEGYCLL